MLNTHKGDLLYWSLWTIKVISANLEVWSFKLNCLGFPFPESSRKYSVRSGHEDPIPLRHGKLLAGRSMLLSLTLNINNTSQPTQAFSHRSLPTKKKKKKFSKIDVKVVFFVRNLLVSFRYENQWTTYEELLMRWLFQTVTLNDTYHILCTLSITFMSPAGEGEFQRSANSFFESLDGWGCRDRI